jgi:hypothetical protein
MIAAQLHLEPGGNHLRTPFDGDDRRGTLLVSDLMAGPPAPGAKRAWQGRVAIPEGPTQAR